MKPIYGICIIFVLFSNSAESSFCRSFGKFLQHALTGKGTNFSDAVIQNVESALTKDKLTKIGTSNFTEIVKMFGHKCEEHEVTTEDGYILRLYHIPGDMTKTVLLVHGNTDNAYGFIYRGKTSLSITLADLGWDVWAINVRGTTESRRHKHLDPVRDSDKFYNYTFYEIGLYDMPATIDYILKETCQTQLTVITHSQGSSEMYVMGSERTEYNEKVKLNVNLGPVATFINIRGEFALFVYGFCDLNNDLCFKSETGEEYLAYRKQAPKYQAICFNPWLIDSCVESFYTFCGRDVRGLEPDFLYTYFGHYPAGTSTKLLNHISQIVLSMKFAKYDYGKERNLEVYHSETPPVIDLGKVTMKTALFTGKNDYYCSQENSDTIAGALPNVVHNEILPYKYFNHLDYVVGRNMIDNFYPYLFYVLEKYT